MRTPSSGHYCNIAVTTRSLAEENMVARIKPSMVTLVRLYRKQVNLTGTQTGERGTWTQTGQGVTGRQTGEGVI